MIDFFDIRKNFTDNFDAFLKMSSRLTILI